MAVHPLAGKPAPRDVLVDVPRLVTAYYVERPDPENAAERVAFGTSGHRGSSLDRSFNDAHIGAICQAIVEHRHAAGVTGPLFVGVDTHALSEPALATAVEVFAAHGVDLMLAEDGVRTPTPVVSHAILTHNRGRTAGLADGVVVTPSHNPPSDGGFKYNPPSGGPADAATTRAIEARANALLRGPEAVRRIPYGRALRAPTTHRHDYVRPYTDDLVHVIDVEAIARSGLRLGVHPLGGASLAFWDALAARWKLDLTIVDRTVDPTFGFMTLDWDGKIRMDCSSPYAMAGLIELRARFDVAFGNDADADRHGIVTPGSGLLNPNHYLTAAIWYLFQRRTEWPAAAAVGKTAVSSAMIDRVALSLGRPLVEVPVGFKWFVDGLRDGSLGFGGEESAGASCLRRDGGVWTTDKDGIVLALLAAEMTAVLGEDPGRVYAGLEERFGRAYYERIDVPATAEVRAALGALAPEAVTATELAGEPIETRLSHAPGNGAPLGGIKLVTRSGWVAARPSGTENVYKVYAESLSSADHLRRLQEDTQAIVAAIGAPGGR